MAAIVGGSGAGKSFLARRLQSALGKEAAILALDDFYKDRSRCSPKRREGINFDHPNAIDWKEFLHAVRELLANQSVLVPQYDFSTHTRAGAGRLMTPKPVILVEGLWLLHRPSLRRLFDYKIFVACPAHTRLRRRLERDAGERGRTTASARRQFFKTVAPMHRLHVAPQARWADLTVRRPLEEPDILQLAEAIRSCRPLGEIVSRSLLHPPPPPARQTALEMHRSQNSQ